MKLGFYKAPVVKFGNDTTICNPATLQLNAGAQFADYLWSTTDKTSTISVKNNGTYHVNIVDKNGCKAGDTIKVAFTDNPRLDLSKLQTLICGSFGTTLQVTSDKTANYTLTSDPRVKITGLSAGVAPLRFWNLSLLFDGEGRICL